MKVELNPINNRYKNSFRKNDGIKNAENYSYTSPSKDETAVVKTKKIISELKIIALGVVLLYFGMKRNIKVNNLRKRAEKAKKLADMKKPASIDISSFMRNI